MMKMKRGKLFFHMPVAMLLKDLDRFTGLSFNCEIYINSEFIDKHSLSDIKLINESFKKRGLLKRIHGPFVDLNPGSIDSKIRQASIERMLSGIKLCSSLECDSIVFHSYYEPIFYGNHFDDWLKSSQGAWDKVQSEAAKSKIRVCVENSIEDDSSAVRAILKAYPAFGACFDVAHYNAFSKIGWRRSLKEYPLGSIKELHLSDNNGEGDEHLALGEGSINFAGLFEEIGRRNENPAVTIEPHSIEDAIKGMRFIEKFISG